MTGGAQLLVFGIIWFAVVPPAVAQIAMDIAEEKIFERPLAFIDRHFRGTLIGYLFRCPVCLSHWITAIIALLFWENWQLVPFGWGLRLVTAIVAIFAATRLARPWMNRA